MNELIREWIDKADSDYRSADRELYPTEGKPNFDLTCYLCQQCVEKYLKGLLQHHGAAFPRTHDLVVLLDLIIPFYPLWEAWRASFRTLKDYAAEFRYPGESANPRIAVNAFKLATTFREQARDAFGIS